MVNQKKNKPITVQTMIILTTFITLVSAGYGMVRYDRELTKDAELVKVEKKLDAKIDTIKAMLMLKISGDVANTITQRIWELEDSYRMVEMPDSVRKEMRKLQAELKKVEAERVYWSAIVRGTS